MKTKHWLPWAAALALVTALPGQAARAAEDHHPHDHGSAQTPKLQLNAGQKWATDAALRQTMDDINQAMGTALPLIHKGRFSQTDYAALAATIRQKVGYAIAHCKLDAQADEMLHLVIAELLAGAQRMEAAQPASRHEGAVQVRRALVSYGTYFQHPGWRRAQVE